MDFSMVSRALMTVLNPSRTRLMGMIFKNVRIFRNTGLLNTSARATNTFLLRSMARTAKGSISASQ